MPVRPPSPDRVTLLASRQHDLRAIARLTSLGPYALRPRPGAYVHQLYVDTSDLTLARYGIAVQFCRQRKRWEATIECCNDQTIGLRTQWEITVPLAGPPLVPFTLPEGPLRIRLSALVAGRPLQPVMILDVRRRYLEVLPIEAIEITQPVAELVLDRVHVRAPDGAPQRALYLEVTVEQRAGTSGDVTRCTHLLQERFNFVPPTESRATRGLALLHAEVALTPAFQVLAQDTVELAARRIVGRHLGRLRQHDPGTRIGEDPEALHDMRVAVRRLRAAVRIFAPGFPPRWQARLRDALKWLGQSTSGVRDLDVQLGRLQHYSTTLPPSHRPGLISLRQHLETERARLRTELLTALDSRRYFNLLVRLEDFACGRSPGPLRNPAAQEPIARAEVRDIKRSLRRLLKRGDKVQGAPTPEDLHALRIRAKRLRYLLEFLLDITGKPGRQAVKHLIRLQDLLGAYHDAVVMADLVHRYAEGPGAQSGTASLLTLGALANSALRVAEENSLRFQRTWRRFTRKRTQREFRMMLRELQGDDATQVEATGSTDPHAMVEAETPTPPEQPAGCRRETGS